MIHTTTALSALDCIRRSISTANQRKLLDAEVTSLKHAVHLLSTAVLDDAMALEQVAWLERSLRQDLSGEWPGCKDLRLNAWLDAHALSGYLRNG